MALLSRIECFGKFLLEMLVLELVCCILGLVRVGPAGIQRLRTPMAPLCSTRGRAGVFSFSLSLLAARILLVLGTGEGRLAL